MQKLWFVFLLVYNCQISWFHTRVSNQHNEPTEIEKMPEVFNKEDTYCFVSNYDFKNSYLDNTKFHFSGLDLASIEKLTTNLGLKNIKTKHIKQIYNFPQNWSENGSVKILNAPKNFERFERINQTKLDSKDKKILERLAELADNNTFFLENKTEVFHFEIPDCDKYIYLSFLKHERDFHNAIFFLLSLGILPTVRYENEYFAMHIRNKNEIYSKLLTYKFGYRKAISWLFFPAMFHFNDVPDYKGDYKFYDHAKDQFLAVLEDKNSKPLPIETIEPVYGDLKYGEYQSDSKLFHLKLPIDKRYAIFRDSKYKVSFSDSLTGLYKLQLIPIKDKIKGELIKNGKEQTYKNFLATNLIQQIQTNFPNSKIITEKYNPNFKDGSYSIVLEINKKNPDKPDEEKLEHYSFLIYQVTNHFYILTRSLPKETEVQLIPSLAETLLLDFQSKLTIFPQEYIEPKLDLDVASESENKKSEDDDDAEEDEGEEILSGGGGVITSEIDLGGIFAVLKKRMYIPQGKLDVKPGRFKFNSARVNSNRFNSHPRTHFKPARTKNFSSPRKWRP
ncbi:hypothetical protein P3G55_13260 [Leptospira sp. 96542]|nr:hypothetical protein [Leptospira sp. 96542]